MCGVAQPFGLSTAPVRGRVQRSCACICRIRERDAAFCGSESGAGAQVLKDNEVRSNEIGPRLAPKALMRIMPGPVMEWLINRSTERIAKAANAICLKDYSSFMRSKEAPA